MRQGGETRIVAAISFVCTSSAAMPIACAAIEERASRAGELGPRNVPRVHG
jgi:hypothetical protein